MQFKILMAVAEPFLRLALGMLRIGAILVLLAFAALLDAAMLFPDRAAGRAARQALVRLRAYTRR